MNYAHKLLLIFYSVTPSKSYNYVQTVCNFDLLLAIMLEIFPEFRSKNYYKHKLRAAISDFSCKRIVAQSAKCCTDTKERHHTH